MADLGGYTGFPDTLPEAQAMIVTLLDEAKVIAHYAAERQRVQDEAVAMIDAARKALNAAEAGGANDA